MIGAAKSMHLIKVYTACRSHRPNGRIPVREMAAVSNEGLNSHKCFGGGSIDIGLGGDTGLDIKRPIRRLHLDSNVLLFSIFIPLCIVKVGQQTANRVEGGPQRPKGGTPTLNELEQATRTSMHTQYATFFKEFKNVKRKQLCRRLSY
jgi:hypothetical protein